MTNRKAIPDADLSSAGDDFHIMWTIKKSLELLNFNNEGLKGITIEGVEENLSKKVDPYGEKFLGIDLTEYFGGDDFASAESIVISQLKYSTRRVNENFTYSKLYEGKKAGSYDGSIIHRLASIFKTFLDEFGREEAIKKIKIKLVSNRNINVSQLDHITLIQKFLDRNKREVSFNAVLGEFPKIPKEPFTKLRTASKLSLKDFTDFIRLLDFEDCGTSSRQSLKFELVRSISKASLKSNNQFNSLFKLIWDKMMPESREERTMTMIDIVANFGFSSIENLFPVSQNFENNVKLIQREQLDEITAVIGNNEFHLPICIHGGAGMGKSTIVQQIKNALPDYCECVLFDCYGAGKYQNPEDKRHLHRNAILFLANELAKNIGTEFLLLQNESDDVYLRELIKRIRNGIEIIRLRNPQAYLVIIIDAADNSITASKNSGERSFVEDILNIEIPDGCRIIATCRTYRKATLNLPNKFIDIDLKPFSTEETKLFAKNNFSGITDEEVLEFHKYTGGIPRVQFYSLSLKKEGINEVINYLKPNGKEVGNLILDKIEEALIRIGKDKKNLVDLFFKLLIALPRPVPIEYLSELMKVEINFLKDLSADIWNGLILDEDFFSFRDEDFENYISETYQITLEERQQITEKLIVKSETDEYASVNLGSFLFTSEYKKELTDIVLNRKFLAVPKDPIRNKQVYVNRTKLALKVSKDIHDDLTYFKLLFIAAEESKTDKALSQLLIKYPDLVSRFGDEVSLSRLKLKSDEKPWAGAFHLKLAGIYSRSPENKEIVLKHLKTAREWLNWRRQKKKDELSDYPISSLDIAYETEAVLQTLGLTRAIRTINSWKPKGVRLSAGNYLIDNVFCFSPEKKIEEWLKYPNFRIDVKLFIICKLFQHNKSIDFDLDSIARFLGIVLNRIEIKFEENFLQLIIQFCGVLAYHKIDSQIILNILNSIKTKQLERIPSFRNSYSHENEEISMDINLFKETLILSLNNEDADIENFYPEKFKNISKVVEYEKRNSLENDKKEFALFFKYAISIYQLHSDILTGRVNEPDCLSKFEKICDSICSDYELRYQSRYQAKDRFLFLSGKLTETALLLDAKADKIKFIIKSFDGQTNKLNLRLEVLGKISLQKELLKVSLILLSESDKIIKDSEMAGKEAVDSYIKCLILSSKVDNFFSKYFFDEAIKATSDIDSEAFTQIKTIYYLSEIGIVEANPKLAYEYSRFIEYCDVKLGSYDKDIFPYNVGLLGIANFDMPSMLASACRWHHKNMIDLGDEMISLLGTALEKGFIDHILASSLLSLKTNYNYKELELLYSSLIDKFDYAADSDQKSKFVRSLFNDLRLAKDQSFVTGIYKQIKSGKFLERDAVSDVKQYVDFLDLLKEKTISTTQTDIFKKEVFLHHINLDELNYTSIKGIEEAIVFIISNDKSSYNQRWAIEHFLSDVVNKCSPDQYISFLDALVDVDDKLLNFDAFENTIEKAINDWSYYPGVNIWKQEKFKYVLLTKLNHFDHGDRFSIWSVRQFANLFSIDDLQLADNLVEILPQKIDLLSDESIYSAFELIKIKLSQKTNEELLIWVLERWNLKIKSDIAEGNWTEELIPTANADENIAQMLRFILGHPSKELRWRAVHSIRRLVNFGDVKIIKILLDSQNRTECFPFQNKKFIFYWMSSKLYLWIALNRISIENPSTIIAFKDLFYKELISERLPHVLIRHYIKKTCLDLYAFDNSIYSDKEFQDIQQINKSRLEYIEEEKYKREQRKYSSKSEKEWQFDFDALDTLPYWYNRVGDLFNLSEYDVADVADMFITEKWGYTGNPNKDDYIREQLYESDWHKTRNQKGNIPEIESLSTYLEYHAMYCAADFLLENEALLKSDSAWETWESWLDSKANSFDNFWLSDLRDPVPLQHKYWKNNIINFDKEWRDSIPEEYFDEFVGFLNNGKNTFLIVNGGIKRNVGVNEETISVRSCLVSNKGADALLRALHSTKDSYDYTIPYEEENDDTSQYDRQSICQDGFFLNGWLTDVRTEYEGLDSDDPFFNGTSKGYIKFGKKVDALFNIEYDNLFKKSYIKNSLISISENWNEIHNEDYRHRKYDTELRTSGSIFSVKDEFILNFLRAEQKSLIIRCVIDRQLEEREYRKREDDNRNRVKLYLIRPDGTVKTLRGRNYKIG
ncbi:ATP-binding protein [Flavobacterium sp. DGU38]|uniref:ATP-binding protein n=1 Tax=Flavobacterium calami TaxID=3139144 RepID=A0ABU9II97_9FLAO